MRTVGITLFLCGERGRHRAAAGAASKYNLAALRLRNLCRIEHRQWDDDRVGVTLDRGLVKLTHVDQHHAAGFKAAGHFFGIEVTYAVLFIRHHRSPDDGTVDRTLGRPQLASAASANQTVTCV